MLLLILGSAIGTLGVGVAMYGIALIHEHDYRRAQRKREREYQRWAKRHRGQRWTW